jgi:hypothetical protein
LTKEFASDINRIPEQGKKGKIWEINEFTPYNPESPSLQAGDEGNFKSKDEEKPRPLGWGYTGFTCDRGRLEYECKR